MSCSTPLCVIKPVLIVAALAGLGAAGYNLATTGCPLGSCRGESANVSAASTAGAEDGLHGCCPGEDSQTAMLAATPVKAEPVDGCPMADGCSESIPGGQVDLVTQGMEGCPMAGAAACEGKSPADCEMDCGECELDCETECPHALPAGQVAESEQAGTESGAG